MYLEGFDVTGILGTNVDENNNGGSNIDALKSYIEGDIAGNAYETQYEVPNLSDSGNEFALEVKEQAKEDAAYTLEANGTWYIKEGAEIGKTYYSITDVDETYTDPADGTEITIEGNENYEKLTDYNNNEYDPPILTITKVSDLEDASGNTSAQCAKIGNYMRIIFRDLEDEIVESVENYIEIDDGTKEKEPAACAASEYFMATHNLTNGQIAVPACPYTYNQGLGFKDSSGVRWEYANDDGGIVPNLMPELAMISGSQNVTHLVELGYDASRLTTSYGKSGGYPVKIEDVVDTYYAYLNSGAEYINSKVNRELTQNEMDALLDTYIWGQLYTGELIDILNSKGTLTVSDFESISTNYDDMNGFPNRKKAAGILFEDGDYVKCTDSSLPVADFKTETPFSDMVFEDALEDDVVTWN